MKLSIPSLFSVLVASVAILTAVEVATIPAVALAQGEHGAHHAAAQAAPAASDYLVQVGKHFMWKSQVEKMHPELKDKAVAVSKANKNDFQIIVDKKPVWASTLRRDPNAKTRPAAHDKACRDYRVQTGKKTAWAADCPMGKHEKGAKPLCCVAPVEGSAKLPHCCQ